MNVKQTVPSARYVTDHTTRLAANVGFFIRRLMFRSMRFLQLNVQKQQNVQHSVMDNASLRKYAALMISGPHV